MAPGMKTSIATVSISGTFPEKLDAIAAAGFDGIEIFETDFLTFGATPRELGKMIGDSGLEITLFQPFRDFEGLPEPLRSRAFERARRKFEVMNELGTDLMLICSNVSPEALGFVDRAAADLRELGEVAAPMGIRVGYEALAWGRHVNDHRDAWEIVRRADHPNVGLILDSFHTLVRRIDPDTIRAIPGDRIFIVQLADAPRIDMDLLYLSRHFRSMPGEGDLPVVDFVRAVAATGYTGPLSLEVFNDQFRGGSPKVIAADGHRSLLYLMDQVQRAEPSPIGHTVPAMPERSPVAGIAFVEFAAAPDDVAPLTQLLGQLGFLPTARHRSKQVTLYRQGDIRLIVNTEPEGLVRSQYVTHGLCAYAFGIEVPDARAAVARAVALDANVFEQGVADGETMVPAIRGVGGGLIYFLDRSEELGAIWEREFVPLEHVANATGGLIRIDHLAQTMDYDQMLTWVLFYRSIFEVDKSPMVDVLDPGGLVRSQVVAAHSGSLRLTLNGADSSRTFAGEFVQRNFGSGIQHLALATDDILATATALENRGFAALAIPGTYYQDLAARHGLDSGYVETLKSHNIFYDRDDRGEFFQMYSAAIGQGFFFEITERRGGYSGYGAPNAPFRIAAQKRAERLATLSI
jgi:4-hydroxyphenylpyruvate dioxygenase